MGKCLSYQKKDSQKNQNGLSLQNKGQNQKQQKKQKFVISFQRGQLASFFSGQELYNRMNIIRSQYIQPIRTKYCQQFFKANMEIFIQNFPTVKDLIQTIQYSYWNDQIICERKKQFNLIKGFTDEKMNQTMIGLIRDVLRSKQLPNDKLLTLSVFLIQAFNIQLYLLTLYKPHLQNFSGRVFRGVSCSLEDYQTFIKIYEQKPLLQRVISVPLSLWSCSKDINKAKNFTHFRRRYGTTIKIVLCINVINLDHEDIQLYKINYPESVVSTICAVQISDPQLTYHPDQKEVLLRGAFCLILQVKNQSQYVYIQCVTVNSNRDHISTSKLGQKSLQARNLFSSINNKARLKFAQKYYSQKKNPSSMKQHHEYSIKLQQQQNRFLKFRQNLISQTHSKKL